MKKRKSIRIRLLEVYVVIMLLVFAINMYIVHSQSQAIRQIDGYIIRIFS
jgi:two-component system sensor histidine kinase YesM